MVVALEQTPIRMLSLLRSRSGWSRLMFNDQDRDEHARNPIAQFRLMRQFLYTAVVCDAASTSATLNLVAFLSVLVESLVQLL